MSRTAARTSLSASAFIASRRMSPTGYARPCHPRGWTSALTGDWGAAVGGRSRLTVREVPSRDSTAMRNGDSADVWMADATSNGDRPWVGAPLTDTTRSPWRTPAADAGPLEIRPTTYTPEGLGGLRPVCGGGYRSACEGARQPM